MRKTILVVVGILLLFFLISVSALATMPIPFEETIEEGTTIAEADDLIFLTSSGYGAGSETPWYDPLIKDDNGNFVQGVWLSNTEPKSISWKFYDPEWHLIYTDTHAPSIKQSGSFNVNGKTYNWAFADYTTFTIPAFPQKGDWWGSPTYKMMDGSAQAGAYTYYIPIENTGSFISSFFFAPVYFLGLKLPAYFWLLGIFWIPAVFLLILIVWARGIEGAVKVINAAREASRKARAQWKKAKPSPKT